MTTTEKRQKAETMRRATAALRLLGDIPAGSQGTITPLDGGGWLVAYGEDEVEMPAMTREEVFILVNAGDLGRPLARFAPSYQSL